MIPGYLKELNDMQYDAAVHMNTPLLILAGAGSGKTRVITSKIAYMMDIQNVHPSSILAVTFTNKAAREMNERVSALLHSYSDTEPDYPPMIRTFHSFGAWVLRRNSYYAGLEPNFTIYDDEDVLTLLQGLYSTRTKKELKPYASMISRAKDYALLPGDDLSAISFDPDFPDMYQKYQTELDKIGNVDFGDLILKPYLLFKNHPEIRERMRQRFKYVLVDEYQDSNVAQFEMLKELCGEGKNLTVVGDDDQSIYRFRGAEVKNILTFPDSFKNTKIIKLEENYRSTENILDIASAVVSNNTGRLGKTLWTRKKGGAKTVISVFNSQNEEASYCATLLDKSNLNRTAVLYRTNAQSLAFESLFPRLGIPYRIVGALKFYDREEIKDILAYLSFLLNTKDIVSFKRIINKPSRGIGKSSQEKIINASLETGGDLFKAVGALYPSLKGKAAKGMEVFSQIISDLNEEMRFDDEKENLSDFIKKVAVRSGFADHYRETDRNSDTQKVQNIEALVNHSSEYSYSMDGLNNLLEEIELDRTTLASGENQEDEGVTLITMHNTKGLEFDRVIITGMEEGLFPGFRSMESEDLIEEERRIFYVSITRARKELYITSCRSRLIWGKINFFSPSRFLSEIPSELYESSGFSSSSISESYSRGDRVYHDDYGSGVVMSIEPKNGENCIKVVFETGRNAVFLEKYCRLEKLADTDW